MVVRLLPHLQELSSLVALGRPPSRQGRSPQTSLVSQHKDLRFLELLFLSPALFAFWLRSSVRYLAIPLSLDGLDIC